MNKKNIVRLMELLGVEKIQESEEWVNASCPFAPFPNSGHKHAVDQRPSFGISVGRKSHYHCFSCQRSGPVQMLISTLIMISGEDNREARALVMEHEDLSLDPYEDLLEEKVPLSVLPMTLIKKFDPANQNVAYVAKRGISDETCAHFNLRYDRIQKRLVFPVFDLKNQLVGFRGRAVMDNDLAKYRAYTELSPNRTDAKRYGVWFGSNLPLMAKHSMVILVEGEIDAVRMWQALKRDGIWSSMGATLSPAQITTIQSLTRPVLLFFDDDHAGELAAGKLISRLKGVNPSVYRITDYCGCKDPDELIAKGLLKKALNSMRKVV